MSVTVRNDASIAPAGARLLYGVVGRRADAGLDAHLERWGALPSRPSASVLDEIEASGLVGHGGAWFPVATKWRAVSRGSRRRPVVVANGAEGEPASHKDAFLLSNTPHLVLDGLSVAAQTLGAERAIVYVCAPSMHAVAAAIGERERRGIDPISFELAEAPDTFISGQESAVVNALTPRRDAVPSFVGFESIRERGVGGRPTLVQNVETLAHVAMIARFGATWFRGIGTADNPGSMLLTVTRPDGPRIIEATLGSSLARTIGITAEELGHHRGVLLGGYGGGWVSTATFDELPVSEKAARRVGSSLGAGVVALLPRAACPLAEMADVVRYMDGQGARQCGPCIHGLAALANVMDDLAYAPAANATRTDRILQICSLTEGRGACRHPDGVVRFIRSGLDVFADDVASHQRHGACAATRSPRVLPIPDRSTGRVRVSRS